MAGEELFKKLKRRSTLLACLVVVIASLALAGWWFDIEFLKHPIRGAASPNPLTSVDFILLAAAFFLLTSGRSSRNKFLIGSLLVFIPIGSSLYTLLDLLFYFPIQIDQSLFKGKLSQDALSNVPSRMAANTALNFILAGTSLLIMSWVPSKPVRHQRIELIVAFVATFWLLGYLYQVPEFYGVLSYVPMAPATAICFILFAGALLFSKSSEGLMRELTGPHTGSLVARFLIPAAVILPVLIGYLRLWGHWLRIFSTEMGVAIIVLSFIICFAAAVWLVVITLNKRDALKKQTDSELSRLSDQLMATNKELGALNEEFVTSNEELVSSNEELMIINERLEAANRTIAKQKDEKLNRVLDSSNDVIWSFDLTGNGENYLSRSAERIYGEPLDKLIQRPRFWLEHLHSDDQAIKKASQGRLETLGFTECTYRIVLPGGIRWIHDRLRLIRDEKGNPQRLEGIATDVTTIKDAQRELDKERSLLRSLIDNIPDFIFVRDAQFRSVINNKASVDLLGAASEKETLGKTAVDYFGEKGRVLMEDDQEVFTSGQAIFNKEETVVLNNRRLTVLATKIPLKDETGKVTALIGIGRDITALKQAEISIRESEERFRTLVENSEDLSVISDFNGNFLFVSSNLPHVLGYENLPGYGEILHPEDKALSPGRMTLLKENPGKSYPLSFRIKHHDGSWRWMEGTSTNLSQVESIKGIVSTYRDVTVRKSIVEELSRNQFFLEKASEAAKIGYWTSEPDLVTGKLTWSNEVFKIFQVDQKDFDGKYETFFHFVHPDDRDKVAEMARLATAGDHAYNIDHRIVLQNGEVRWVNERAQVVRNERNEVLLMVGIVQDITERKTVEEMLREYNARYEILSQATNDVIWDWDILQDTVLYNHGMHTVLGYSELEMKSTGAWWDEQIHPEDRDRILNEIKAVFEEQLRTWDSVYRYRTAGGNYKYIHDRAYVVYSNAGQPVRMIGAMQDVTELSEYRFGLEKKVEERTLELNLALQKEKELVEMKNKFVSIASHEFRTPLSTISFAAESIRNYFHQLTAVEINRKLIKIEDQASHMTNLLEDILTIGRSDAGKIEVKRISLDLKEFIDSLIEEIRATVREKREINFIFSCISSKVNVDDKLLRNVVNNLLTNALKFSAADTTITIAVSDFNGDILIEVTDEGIGIEESELTSIFESFQRGSNASAVQGTGLGLSILKKALELMDGSIEVKSKVNIGSTFRVQIPIH